MHPRLLRLNTDLAIALAIASSRLDRPVPSDVAACGEIGLGGEVRRVARTDLRVREVPEGLVVQKTPSDPPEADHLPSSARGGSGEEKEG